MLNAQEVAKHRSRESCWVIIAGKVYDLTAFLDDHPGGAKSILRNGGKDATKEYELLHPPGTIEKTLAPNQHLGAVDETTISLVENTQNKQELHLPVATPISFCMNLDDIERAARRVLSRKAWTYFNSAADSLESLRRNKEDWKMISFRPRILRNVARVSMERKIMGQTSRLPFFIAPAAMAKLAHEDGELCLARGAVRHNIPYCMSTYSSVSHEEIAACFLGQSTGCLFFQLYIAKSKERTLELIAIARKLGFKALVVTVDTPVVGKREEDERYQAEIDYEAGVEIPRTQDPAAVTDAPILRGAHSSTFEWNDLEWVRQAWGGSGPVILKGIQTAEDAKQASLTGVDGIYLSNHGGRQIDYGPSSIQTLLEIRKFFPEVLQKIDIYMDGGIRRGADIVKALCLGATAVALGRPFMYALGAYGTEGVVKAIQILSDEVETTMRLLGVTALSQLNPNLVNATALERCLPLSITDNSIEVNSKL